MLVWQLVEGALNLYFLNNVVLLKENIVLFVLIFFTKTIENGIGTCQTCNKCYYSAKEITA